MRDRLFQSCMVHSLKHMGEAMAQDSCACMAQEFIDHELVTDEMRDALAIDWNAGIDWTSGTAVGEKDAEWAAIGMAVWSICARKLYPDMFASLADGEAESSA